MSDEYVCKSGLCIPQLSVCDSQEDCPDGDDEGESCECARNEVCSFLVFVKSFVVTQRVKLLHSLNA